MVEEVWDCVYWNVIGIIGLEEDYCLYLDCYFDGIFVDIVCDGIVDFEVECCVELSGRECVEVDNMIEVYEDFFVDYFDGVFVEMVGVCIVELKEEVYLEELCV